MGAVWIYIILIKKYRYQKLV